MSIWVDSSEMTIEKPSIQLKSMGGPAKEHCLSFAKLLLTIKYIISLSYLLIKSQTLHFLRPNCLLLVA
jgi:hypothetical protein